MSEYFVVVLTGDKPEDDVCNYLSSIDKNGAHFSHDVDDAIVFVDKERCIYLARAVKVYPSVDVYSVKENTIRSFEFVW